VKEACDIAWIVLVNTEMSAIEPGQAITCTQPDEAFAVLDHMVHKALREPLDHVIAGHLRLLCGSGKNDRDADEEESMEQVPAR
jgi:hypothetical protein